ncbi:MAG: efflux RND transporter permease subunit [Candidatus Sumerlaeota bacterium]|nr:efflux RND transporter permease subunit [Candidatus Sumerlaeota bacterium]
MTTNSSKTGVAAFSLRHAKALILIIVGLCLAGGAALLTMPSGIYPDVTFPRIAIVAERGEEPVENMMIGVARPIEEAVNAVPGLTRVRSKTIRGAVEMSLDFSAETDMRDALAQTRARVTEILPKLLTGLTATIEQQNPSVFPVISFNVSLDAAATTGTVRDGAALLQWTNMELKPRLTRLRDVFMVTVQGAQERRILVEADPGRLAAASLSLTDIVKAVGAANAIDSVGLLERDYQQFQIIASNELKTLDDINSIPVATRRGKAIRLSDVATVHEGLADATKVVSGNGHDSCVVSVFMRYAGKVTDLSDNVKETLSRIKANLPAGVTITPVYDQADLVRDSLNGVRDAIGLGMLLSIVVLLAFLGSWRLMVVAGVSIPISVLGTFALMTTFHQSLNLMSLGGIAIAIGLIIDNAIVVVENIARSLSAAESRREAVVRATNEIFGAVTGSSLTTVVVFVPLVLLEGVVGQFFRAMSVTLSIGILVSLAVSLTLTPVMSAGWFGPRPGERTARRWTEWLAGIYEKLIRRILRHPWIAAVILCILVAAGAWEARHQETGFLPQMDEGGFVLDYFMPVGTSLSETDKNCRRIEAILLETPQISSFSRRTGAELGFFATEQFTGDFLVGLKPRSERQHTTIEVIDDLRKRVAREVPQIEVEFIQVMQDTINDLAGNPSPLEVKVFGMDYRVLQTLAGTVAGQLEKIPGVVDIKKGVSFGSPEITYRFDPVALGKTGLTCEDAESQMRAALLGEDATVVRRGEFLIPVTVRYPDWVRRDPAWLERIPLASASGHSIPASLISRVEEKRNFNELARENQQPLVSVTAGISGRDLGSVARDVRATLKRILLPRGTRFELAGQIESQTKAFENLMVVFGLAMGLVFVLLVMQFRSFRLPLIIFLALPFSPIGGLIALRLTGTELNISAFMGLIMLVGIVVRNGIILIEYTEQLRIAGAPTLLEALTRAARIRLRPILMTSLTAIMALLPLALNIGAGAELQRPLAIVVIGGLSLSTVFTLLVVPVAHILLGEPQRIHEES